MGGACSTRGRDEKCIQGFDGNTKCKYSGSKPIRGWEDNIKMVFKEIIWGGIDWINLARDNDQWWALFDMAMDLRVP
jgi:hypothetical protein